MRVRPKRGLRINPMKPKDEGYYQLILFDDVDSIQMHLKKVE